jgi:lipopolysaccharide transport system permease protein
MPPLLLSTVFSITVGKVIDTHLKDIPYIIFAFSGLIFWNLFSSVVSRSSNILIHNSQLISKLYFPRVLLPLSSSGVGTADFTCSLVVLLGLLIFFNISIGFSQFLIIFPAVIITLLFGSGIGMLFSGIYIQYKDVRELLPLITSVLFFLTPVIYPVKLVSHYYYPLLYINPMMGVIDTVRLTLFGPDFINWNGLLVSSISAVIFFCIGLFYFRQIEKELADII